jgi:hydrogenase maturation protein HypF
VDAQRILVNGTVQGVGFRPYVYSLALRHRVTGWVRNTSSGVEIQIEGMPEMLAVFTAELPAHAPPLARIDRIVVQAAEPEGASAFSILESVTEPGAFQPISPDIALCPDCRRELFDPQNRRYLYPFINCTRCGPRLTIIRDVPYDRARTSMQPFTMCSDCRREYENPLDRRFHAEPTACPVCGPQVWLAVDGSKAASHLDAILQTRRKLREGKIVAVRGLGGFHLACDASNQKTIHELRKRKRRYAKPFAVMVADEATALECGALNSAEQDMLAGREAPIVIVRRRADCALASEVAPGAGTLGIFLAYTPLHALLLAHGIPELDIEPAPRALVMTSGNLSEEPISIANEEALERLAPIADAFLLHDREIIQRCDDSVVRVFAGAAPQVLRRSRGFAPAAICLVHPSPPVLAVGGELKNTFCLARGDYAFLSPHIGDMENAETLDAFSQGVERYKRLFHTEPEAVAHDLHPGYMSTQWALERFAPERRHAVQHHHAHAAACIAENGLPPDQRVIALTFDGTGYGTDGAIWGGEVMLADCAGFERYLHLDYLPLPGGDTAIRKPWRTAVGYCAALGIAIDDLPFLQGVDSREVEVVRRQTARGLNAPQTSSMGRLFDAVAALAGVRNEIDYEAQGAIELEELSRAWQEYAAPYTCQMADGVIHVRDLLAAVVEDARSGQSATSIGARFHQTITKLAVDACQLARSSSGVRTVVLSGGVWQNELLFSLALPALRTAGFTVYTHRAVPANDGGLALGQAAVAAERIRTYVSGNSR